MEIYSTTLRPIHLADDSVKGVSRLLRRLRFLPLRWHPVDLKNPKDVNNVHVTNI